MQVRRMGLCRLFFKIFICLILLLPAAVSVPVLGANGWKSARVVPGAQVLASGRIKFETCFTARNSGAAPWFRCSDRQRRSPLRWGTVWPAVHRDIDFQLNEPGFVYLLFTTRVNKSWRYDGAAAVISKMEKNGKWNNVWFGPGLRYALFRNGKLVSTGPYVNRTGPPALRYRIRKDGRIQFWEGIPKFGTGRYRLTVTEAMFHNSNTAEKTYFPCRVEYKLLFVPEKVHPGTVAAPPLSPGRISGSLPCTWVVNNTGRVYRLTKNYGWQYIPGRKARDVGVGADGSVWIVGTNPVYGGYDIYRWIKNRFVRIDGGAVRLDVGPRGAPWVVNKMHDIYRWNRRWERMPGKAVDVGIGADGSVFVLGTRKIPGGYEIYKWNGSNWKRIPGAAVRIDVDDAGNPWVVNDAGGIYKWSGSGWRMLPGRGTDITAGGESRWVLGTDSVPGGHGIYKWNSRKRNWDRIPGGAVAISTGGRAAGTKPMPAAHIARLNLKTGKYNVKVYIDNTLYTSVWTLRIRKGKITGMSSWSCCPRPRTDAMRGKIAENRVVIRRDCSGQGWNGGCVQIYTGKIKGNRIEGTATGTGLRGHKTTWVLDLKSRVPIFNLRRR
ncbi:MAG: hypothetical protein GXO69_05240 [Acidobacteria bacterium]|nr:hypothetical protein [Acidobacteriota bacterium]